MHIEDRKPGASSSLNPFGSTARWTLDAFCGWLKREVGGFEGEVRSEGSDSEEDPPTAPRRTWNEWFEALHHYMSRSEE